MRNCCNVHPPGFGVTASHLCPPFPFQSFISASLSQRSCACLCFFYFFYAQTYLLSSVCAVASSALICPHPSLLTFASPNSLLHFQPSFQHTYIYLFFFAVSLPPPAAPLSRLVFSSAVTHFIPKLKVV